MESLDEYSTPSLKEVNNSDKSKRSSIKEFVK